MKAKIFLQVHCPVCGAVMRRFTDDDSGDVVECIYRGCAARGVLYEAPTVELRPAGPKQSRRRGPSEVKS